MCLKSKAIFLLEAARTLPSLPFGFWRLLDCSAFGDIALAVDFGMPLSLTLTLSPRFYQDPYDPIRFTAGRHPSHVCEVLFSM